MTKIFMLVDYKKYFGSKYTATPYRSGMDKELLKTYFNDIGYAISYLSFPEISFDSSNYRNEYILYSSSEDHNYLYKSYIEDICYALSLQGAILIPEYKYLRAHSNKVFMELLRDLSKYQGIKNIKSRHYGSLEELIKDLDNVALPAVLKGAGGAKSKYVSCVTDKIDLIKKASRLSRSKSIYHDFWDMGRSYKHKGYIRESKHRRKFILQNFIDGLMNDWKILIFGEKYFVLKRQTRKNDFRASGSGIFQFQHDVPSEVLNFSKNIFNDFEVPNLSLDIGYDGNKAYLFEFQAVLFGSTTLEKSPFYYLSKNGEWFLREEKSILEKIYAESIDFYLKNTRDSRGKSQC